LLASDYWKKRVSRILVVDCPEEVQVQRVMQRNNMRREQVAAIMATQASRADRLAAADDVILNAGSIEQLPAQVARLHTQYLSLSQSSLPSK
jgi:dephospho-CoA kinase